jgi:RNA polymerase-binding protein DksA
VSSPDQAREALTLARADAVALIVGLERELAGIIEAAGAASGGDDEHDPEGATVAFERQHVAALLERAREDLVQIDAALVKVAEGRYGWCESCGQPIGAERLAARPAATTCIRCASRAAGR